MSKLKKRSRRGDSTSPRGPRRKTVLNPKTGRRTQIAYCHQCVRPILGGREGLATHIAKHHTKRRRKAK